MLFIGALFQDREERDIAETIYWIHSQIKPEQLQAVWKKLGSTQRGWIKKYLELNKLYERKSIYPLPRCDVDGDIGSNRDFHQQ